MKTILFSVSMFALGLIAIPKAQASLTCSLDPRSDLVKVEKVVDSGVLGSPKQTHRQVADRVRALGKVYEAVIYHGVRIVSGNSDSYSTLEEMLDRSDDKSVDSSIRRLSGGPLKDRQVYLFETFLGDTSVGVALEVIGWNNSGYPLLTRIGQHSDDDFSFCKKKFIASEKAPEIPSQEELKAAKSYVACHEKHGKIKQWDQYEGHPCQRGRSDSPVFGKDLAKNDSIEVEALGNFHTWERKPLKYSKVRFKNENGQDCAFLQEVALGANNDVDARLVLPTTRNSRGGIKRVNNLCARNWVAQFDERVNEFMSAVHVLQTDNWDYMKDAHYKRVADIKSLATIPEDDDIDEL